NVTQVDGDKCYPSLSTLPEKVDGVVIVVHPQETEHVVRDVEAAGIQHVWMQQGSESENAIQYCREHNLSEIHGECILMFTEPVKSFHRFHRFMNRCFGKLPN